MIGFGILQSTFHECWCTYFGNRIGAGNQRRYNASYVYLTFPFPAGLTPDTPMVKLTEKRTLTNLYNARPAWLDHAHRALDEAVAEAYGWGDDWRGGILTDDEILARLFRLNQERAVE